MFLDDKRINDYKIIPEGKGRRNGGIIANNDYLIKKLTQKYCAIHGYSYKEKFEEFLNHMNMHRCYKSDLKKSVKERLKKGKFTTIKYEGFDVIKLYEDE